MLAFCNFHNYASMYIPWIKLFEKQTIICDSINRKYNNIMGISCSDKMDISLEQTSWVMFYVLQCTIYCDDMQLHMMQ